MKNLTTTKKEPRPMGVLYVVATPIGNREDITLRALNILQTVDLIATEDTRHSQGLLKHHGIDKPLIALHSHNETSQTVHLLKQLQQGTSIALISDAGTPCIHDPGAYLIHQAHNAGIQVVPIPGPCAITTALSVAGLQHQPFLFEGFLPVKQTARRKQLAELAEQTRTLIFYEAPHRIMPCLDDMQATLGEERQAVIARELTKQFETLYRGTLSMIDAQLQKKPDQCRGEFVLIVAGKPKEKGAILPAQTLRLLTALLAHLPTRQAVDIISQCTGTNKNKLYQAALKIT